MMLTHCAIMHETEFQQVLRKIFNDDGIVVEEYNGQPDVTFDRYTIGENTTWWEEVKKKLSQDYFRKMGMNVNIITMYSVNQDIIIAF